jgi:hypothetical protein
MVRSQAPGCLTTPRTVKQMTNGKHSPRGLLVSILLGAVIIYLLVVLVRALI